MHPLWAFLFFRQILCLLLRSDEALLFTAQLSEPHLAEDTSKHNKTNTREQYQSRQGRQAPEKAFKASTHVTELRSDSFGTLPRENEYCIKILITIEQNPYCFEQIYWVTWHHLDAFLLCFFSYSLIYWQLLNKHWFCNKWTLPTKSSDSFLNEHFLKDSSQESIAATKDVLRKIILFYYF